jgi:hypothetical protein
MQLCEDYAKYNVLQIVTAKTDTLLSQIRKWKADNLYLIYLCTNLLK